MRDLPAALKHPDYANRTPVLAPLLKDWILHNQKGEVAQGQPIVQWITISAICHLVGPFSGHNWFVKLFPHTFGEWVLPIIRLPPILVCWLCPPSQIVPQSRVVHTRWWAINKAAYQHLIFFSKSNLLAPHATIFQYRNMLGWLQFRPVQSLVIILSYKLQWLNKPQTLQK